jgi:hypothetical protein
MTALSHSAISEQHRKEIVMRNCAITVLTLLTLWNTGATVRAADSCNKECREDYRACKGAHSEGACRTNYDICVKHCKK